MKFSHSVQCESLEEATSLQELQTLLVENGLTLAFAVKSVKKNLKKNNSKLKKGSRKELFKTRVNNIVLAFEAANYKPLSRSELANATSLNYNTFNVWLQNNLHKILGLSRKPGSTHYIFEPVEEKLELPSIHDEAPVAHAS